MDPRGSPSPSSAASASASASSASSSSTEHTTPLKKRKTSASAAISISTTATATLPHHPPAIALPALTQTGASGRPPIDFRLRRIRSDPENAPQAAAEVLLEAMGGTPRGADKPAVAFPFSSSRPDVQHPMPMTMRMPIHPPPAPSIAVVSASGHFAGVKTAPGSAHRSDAKRRRKEGSARRWRELTSRQSLCRSLPSLHPDGSVNWFNFKNLGVKNKGTEGTCFKCYQQSTGKVLAMKKARVFPKGEGVPYYMLRELAVLKGIKHDHIASLELISLAKDELHVFFPYVDKTLHEIINPTGDPNGGRVLPERVIRRLLHQLLDAIAYCHRRGVLHRNLKPKHLLISTSNVETLDDASLQISDFALVRATGIPRRTYTMEVVTLWYRPPEILMGVRGYSSAVDIWSVGCIFAEMAQGKPLFTGISEIDQLFQIFSKLSTPTSESWPGFRSLPNYHFDFPNWKHRPLKRLFPSISDLGLDLLSKLLTYNPDQRITAEDALRHPYFVDASPEFLPLTPTTIQVDGMSHMMDRVESDMIPEHVKLFYVHLRRTELESWKEIKYLSRQKTLRPAHRSMLVDWLIEVVDVFEMCLRTAFLAVNYTDRFLDIVMVKKKKFQLLGATCLHVASKCEDVSYIGVEDLAMCADNVYTSAEVLKMEEKLLNTLSFTLSVPTALDFLNIFERMMPPIQKRTSMLAHYLLELALQEYRFLRYKPSMVATCCLSLAMYTVEGFPMTKELADACQYGWADLKDCMTDLHAVYRKPPSNEWVIIRRRYSKSERCNVAEIVPPATINMNAW